VDRELDLDRERRLHALLLQALALPPERRRRHVVEAAGDDRDLAAEVLDLLAGEDGLEEFLETPAAVGLDVGAVSEDRPGPGAAGEAAPPGDLPARIGPFTILERLGSGGMGEVFRALQEEPVRREVALKRVRAHLPAEALDRFVVEQQALARLGHTHVARLYDAGTTADGQPYFAMELLQGRPVTTYCDEERLGVEERLEIFLGICAGVEHAHQKQVLHRDLKPSNVLVVEESGRPVPKVIDFGIAKSLGDPGTGLTFDTRLGLVGTPAYMSPEALASGRVEGGLDTRSDVYSLGVLLFELLTGRTPYDEGDPGLVELISRIEEGREETPSNRLRRLTEEESGEVAAQRGISAGDLVRRVRDDLDWVVAKAMAPERERRYRSVGELAADVERHLRDEPVEARPPSAAYRLSKLARRHRAAFAASVVALAGLVVGTVGLVLGLVEARREAEAARQALAETSEVSSFLTGLFDASRPGSEPADQISAQDLLDRGAEELESRFAGQPAARGRFLRAIADVYVQMGRYDQAAPMLEEAVALLTAALPADHPDLAQAIRSQAVLAFHRGRWSDAEILFRAGSEGLDPAAQPEDWALAAHNVGVALYKQGRSEEAEAEFLRALEVRERSLPADHPHLARSLSALGAIYVERGDAERAVELYRRALEHLERTLGPRHAHVALALTNLAQAYRGLGRWDEAEAALDRAIEIQEATVGPEHPDLAQPLNTLGLLLVQRGELARAERALLRALEVRRAALGDESPWVAESMRNLGSLYLEMGRLDEAEPLLRRALEVRERAGLPEASLEHPRMDLGLIALERGDLVTAEAALAQSLRVWEEELGPDHRNLSWPLLGLARIRQLRGDLAGAEPLYRRALEIRERGYFEGHRWLREARERYAELLRLEGRHDEAERLLAGGA
jgi:non-specific serine/threonine protein kinase/serine/threonine-protein kinase